MADIPHFRFPFALSANGASVVVDEQDSIREIESCENVIIRCPTGWREEKPDFGWPFPEFASAPIDTTALEAALRRFEPRGKARGFEYADAADAAVRHISVDVEVS